MVGYNLTNITNANTTGVLDFVVGVNRELLFNSGGVIMIIGIFVVLIMGFFSTTGDIRKAMLSSSFICFILSLSLRALGLVPNLAIYIFLVLTVGVMLFAFHGE